MSGVKKSLFLKSGTTTPDPVSSDLKLHWDTTQTSGSGSTGTLTALAGSATGDMIDSGDVDKSDSSSVDSAGNQGWKFQAGSSSTNTILRASQSVSTIFGATSSNWTIEIWAKIDSRQSVESVFLNSFAGSYNAYGTGQNWIIGLYGASSGLHSLTYKDGGSPANNYVNLGSAGMNYGSFAQYVVTADNLGVKNYKNSVLDGSVGYNGSNSVGYGLGSTTGTPRTTAADFNIGGRPDTAYTNKSWNGVFRICRVYAKALSQTEVTNNFNAEKAKFGL